MTKKKKKQMVTILILVVILLAVAVAYMVSTKHKKAKEDKENQKISLLSLDSSLANEIDIKNDNGKIKFVKKDGLWALDGDDSFTVDQDKVDKLAKEFGKIEANKSIQNNQDNLSEYGLDDPQAVGTIVLSDGTKATISFGSETPSEEGSYYGILEGNDSVYTFAADKFTSLFSDKTEFKGTVATASPDAAPATAATAEG